MNEKNDETIMTNDEGSTNAQMTKKHSQRELGAFGFCHLFVIGHSSFVIFF
jgi:hypothetical protein